jgi:hypothetical protein
MLDVSLYPVVTEPMIPRLPSRMKYFLNMSPPVVVYRVKSQNGHPQSFENQRVVYDIWSLGRFPLPETTSILESKGDLGTGWNLVTPNRESCKLAKQRTSYW